MKRSSEILLVAALLAASFVLPTMQADDAPDAAERRASFAAELGLSADQQSRLQAIREQERSALSALKADASLSPEQKRERARALHQDYATQRRAVFTAEQKTLLKEKRAERGSREEKPRRGGARPRRG